MSDKTQLIAERAAKFLTTFGTDHEGTNSKSSTLEPVQFTPRDFFVAFGGVICVAFDGFPIHIEAMKAAMESSEEAKEWHPQNMGSKWAKSTLGAIRQEKSNDGKVFTPEILAEVRAVCLKHREALRATRAAIPSLQVVQYENRSLTRRGNVIDVPMPLLDSSVESRPALTVSEAMLEKTASVVNDFTENDGTSDVFKTYVNTGIAAKPSYAAHYVAEAHGATVVADLLSQPQLVGPNAAFAAIIAAFRHDIDALLGEGVVHWMEDECLHCTIRGLV